MCCPVFYVGGISSEGLAAILAAHEIWQPEAVATRVSQAVKDNLANGGRFIAYQCCRDVAWITDPVMGAHASGTLELRNIPPMRVYSCFKSNS